MKALIANLPAFVGHRKDYLGDEGLRRLQNRLAKNQLAWDMIEAP